MNGLGKPFRKNSIISTEKTVKTEKKLPHVHKNRNRESEFPFKHRFLPEFESSTEKKSRRKITRFFAPLPVSA